MVNKTEQFPLPVGGGGFNSSTVGTGAVSETKAEGVVPMLVKQVLNCPEEGPQLFGMNFGIVTLVGLVRNVEHSSTKITYLLEDHSGKNIQLIPLIGSRI